ncbi:hypothetical protein MTBLM5_70138 [Magnetospirillum sp. LM-5]|nr:hypothetical protein MTBLM5_70138 [Magnetospirillum sp. LM-5]
MQEHGWHGCRCAATDNTDFGDLRRLPTTLHVMAGLGPAIHAHPHNALFLFDFVRRYGDARVKHGHDEGGRRPASLPGSRP